jgi:GNAT superfamily N-acetyltransferase
MIASRIARPTRSLARSIEFYRDRLGLAHTGGFHDHDGYDGAFFALPGGGELELTAGPVEPTGWSEEDLLVLYVGDQETGQRWSDALAAHGVPEVAAANPYWNRTGHTVLDPDGYRVVIAVRDRDDTPVQIDWHDGDRAELRPLFELAEDSAEQLAGYLEFGRVLVARRDGTAIGQLQLVPTDVAGEIELKNMAVSPDQQGTGVGRKLVQVALGRGRGVRIDDRCDGHRRHRKHPLLPTRRVPDALHRSGRLYPRDRLPRSDRHRRYRAPRPRLVRARPAVEEHLTMPAPTTALAGQHTLLSCRRALADTPLGPGQLVATRHAIAAIATVKRA